MDISNAEQIAQYKDKIAPELYNNPRFISEIVRCIAIAKRFSGADGVDFNISADGKTVTILKQYIPNAGAGRRTNESGGFIYYSFSLGQNRVMNCDYFRGTLYEPKVYYTSMAESWRTDQQGNRYMDKQKYQDADKFDSILSTIYFRKSINENGIEFYIAEFQDRGYPLQGVDPNETDKLRTHVLEYHKPTGWGYLDVNLPIYCKNARMTTWKREFDNLGLIYVSESHITIGRRSAKTTNSIYAADTELPERLYGTHLCDVVEGKFQGTDKYPELSDSEIEAKLAEAFIYGIETSKTKEENPAAYHALKKYASKMCNKYGINNPSQNKNEEVAQTDNEMSEQIQQKKKLINDIISAMLNAGEFHNSGLDVSQKFNDIKYARRELETESLEGLEYILSVYTPQQKEEMPTGGIKR